jgi:hypothetical protein
MLIMTRHNIAGYCASDICRELERRARAGENVNRYLFIGGMKVTFIGRARETRAKLREGSQRWLALRNVHTTRALMKEIQYRMANGDYAAYLEWRAMGPQRVAVGWRQ